MVDGKAPLIQDACVKAISTNVFTKRTRTRYFVLRSAKKNKTLSTCFVMSRVDRCACCYDDAVGEGFDRTRIHSRRAFCCKVRKYIEARMYLPISYEHNH